VSKNRLACRVASYRPYMDACWQHLPQIGVEYVEVGIPETPEQAERLREQLAGKLRVSSFQGKLDIQQDDVAAQLAPQLDACKSFGADRLFLSVRKNDLPEHTAYARLRAAGEAARQSGVLLILETHPDLVTNGDVGARTMQGVGHSHVRINFDTANIYFYNDGADCLAELEKVLEWVEGVHFKDSKGRPRDHDFPVLGRGIVDFPRVVRRLNERGFYGPFTIELERARGVELSEDETLEEVAESVRYLRSTGLF